MRYYIQNFFASIAIISIPVILLWLAIILFDRIFDPIGEYAKKRSDKEWMKIKKKDKDYVKRMKN